MKLKKFIDFLTESKIEELVLESKVVLSDRFINLLSRMSSNKVAQQLIDVNSKDFATQHNYIDVTDNKEELSFTPDRKVQELIGNKPVVYVVGTRRQLTHSDTNDAIFDILGYDRYQDIWRPDSGQKGIIKAETVSQQSDKVFVLFEELTDNEEKRLAVLNKDSLSVLEPNDSHIWNTSRNPIRVGRLVRPLLRAAGVSVTDQELEEFVNQWKATYDFASNALNQFDIVQGDDIKKWYWYENYQEGGGSMNNSCMSHVSSELMDIYAKNPQVSLVILYSDKGEMVGDKYVSKKIKGRAILWDCTILGGNEKFMDRIYTVQDSDVELFKQFAQKNKWYYKEAQTMEPNEKITRGQSPVKAEITAELDYVDLDFYPYCDTLCYLYPRFKIISNVYDQNRDVRVLRTTDGEYYDEP